MKPITFGSVCSGIEAASVAWNPLGWQAAWLSEIEPFPCAVLAHHYPSVPNLGDMTKIAPMLRAGEVPAPDVFCGGTPCQAFSIAGLRNSLDDARGNLSLTFCEIANEIDARRTAAGSVPCVVFWENVPGCLNTKDNFFGCFLAGLAGEDDPLVAPRGKWPDAGVVVGPQRTVAWRVFDAQFFSLAQRRRRVFVVASAREGFDPAAVLFEFDGLRRDSAPRRETREDAAAGTLRSSDGGSDLDHARAGHLQPVGWPADLASTLNAAFGSKLGLENQHINSGAPLFVPHTLSVALRGREGGATAELGDEVTGCLRASTGGGDKPHVLAPIAFSSKDYGADACIDLAPTLRAGGHSDSHANAGVPPAIAFDARQDPVSSEHVFGALGSSSPQAQAVAFSIRTANTSSNGWGIQEEVTHTLDCTAGPAVCVTGASEDGTGRGQPIGATAGAMCAHTYTGGMGGRVDMAMQGYAQPAGMAVRRLTPRECERLQGFPDDYTLIPVRRANVKVEADGEGVRLIDGTKMVMAADGPRYKALGNSWAVPNVRWIGRRIDAQMRALSGSI